MCVVCVCVCVCVLGGGGSLLLVVWKRHQSRRQEQICVVVAVELVLVTQAVIELSIGEVCAIHTHAHRTPLTRFSVDRLKPWRSP